jgi:hypothetical protein
MGGLGNQMFQYAFYRRIQETYNYETKVDIEWFENPDRLSNRHFYLDRFKTQLNIASHKEIKKTKGNKFLNKLNRKLGIKIPFYYHKYIIEKNHGNFSKGIFDIVENTYFSGYWQSEKYFKQISKKLEKEFSFKNDLKEKNKAISKEILNSNSVSLHIRRGDYIENKNVKNKLGNVCDLEYYNKSIEYLEKELFDYNLYVFSDDIDWAKKNISFNKEIKFIDWNKGSKSYKDMQLMSLCKHNIIANSTFSWWGAWLNSFNEKIVIAPERWTNSNFSIRKDVVPDDWIKL